MRLLIVEDEPALAQSLERGLRQRGFAVDVATDGQAALDRALVTDYDVIVLDRDLPLVHGDEVCRTLTNGRTTARILMLTAAAELDDLVEGFSLGADDYLAKPFQFAELVARLHALIRRSAAQPPAPSSFAGIDIDTTRMEARRNGVTLTLTAREFAVLELLVRAEGRIVSSEELLEHAWDEHADPFTTSVRVMVSRLRTKLGEPSVISTIVGRGYRLGEDLG